jgi:hypothetical protein
MPVPSRHAQIASVIGQLVQAQQQSPVSSPLLLMTDQEGGEVRRLPGAPVLSEKQRAGQRAAQPDLLQRHLPARHRPAGSRPLRRDASRPATDIGGAQDAVSL